ncbi:19404_t:CDS:1, partial [Dentiscutata erythropus]
THNGFDLQTFHQQYNNQGPTVVVMKVANSSENIGRHNSIEQKVSSGHSKSRESFLFSYTLQLYKLTD